MNMKNKKSEISNGLLAYKKNLFTQNGEDGIVEAIFQAIGAAQKTCCEFGAWDGIHLSNCRKLILDGWTAVMIEGDENKYNNLCSNYASNEKVFCVNSYVDDSINSLDRILRKNCVTDLDFLSIDIDGLDYEIFSSLDCRPTVICVEVNAGHSPDFDAFIDREIAKDNVGQSLKKFCDAAQKLGYGLICYNGNAFFLRDDYLKCSKFQEITPAAAYTEFLNYLEEDERLWLFWVNLGLVAPYYRYKNPYLTLKGLRLHFFRSIRATLKVLKSNWRQVRKFI